METTSIISSSAPRAAIRPGWNQVGVLMLMPSGVLFVAIFYVIPFALAMKHGWLWFPFMGESLSFLLQSAILFVLLFGTLTLLGRIEESIPWLRNGRLTGLASNLTRATGLPVLDPILASCSLAAGIYLAWRGAWLLVPLAGVSLIVFGVLAFAAEKGPWPINRFEARLPDKLPESPAASAVSDGPFRECEWSWIFPREDGRFGSGARKIRLRDDDYQAARQTNPCLVAAGEQALPENDPAKIATALLTGAASPPVVELAHFFFERARAEKHTLFEMLNNMLVFVQTIGLETRPPDVEKTYWRSPLETLYDNLGDTADKALLLTAILRAIFNPNPDKPSPLRALLLYQNDGNRAVAALGGPELTLPDDFFELDGIHYYCGDPAPNGRVGQPPALPSGMDWEVIAR